MGLGLQTQIINAAIASQYRCMYKDYVCVAAIGQGRVAAGCEDRQFFIFCSVWMSCDPRKQRHH